MAHSLFAWLISHQPAVLFSQNKSATSNQPVVLFSQNKPATSQPNRLSMSSISHPEGTNDTSKVKPWIDVWVFHPFFFLIY
jgi:hypothetical protein